MFAVPFGVRSHRAICPFRLGHSGLSGAVESFTPFTCQFPPGACLSLALQQAGLWSVYSVNLMRYEGWGELHVFIPLKMSTGWDSNPGPINYVDLLLTSELPADLSLESLVE